MLFEASIKVQTIPHDPLLHLSCMGKTPVRVIPLDFSLCGPESQIQQILKRSCSTHDNSKTELQQNLGASCRVAWLRLDRRIAFSHQLGHVGMARASSLV